MAIVLFLLLVVMFGVEEFARALYSYHMVANAARLGTRFAIVRGSGCVHTALPDPWPCPATSSEIENFVRVQSIGVGLDSPTVTTAWSAGSGCSQSPYEAQGCIVSVTVTYPFHFIVPFVSSAAITMTSTSKMVISQ